MRNWMLLAVLAVPSIAAGAEPEKVVVIEARFLHLPDKPYQDLKFAEELNKTEYKFLAVNDLAKLRSAVESCKNAAIVAAPKVTVDNNQTATVDLTRKHSYVSGLTIIADAHGGAAVEPKVETKPVGLSFRFTPRITADGQRIRLKLEIEETTTAPSRQLQVTTPVTPRFEGGSIGAPVTEIRFIEPGIFNSESYEKSVVIPDGQSMLLKLGSRERHCSDFGPPIVSRVPYINRLFKTNNVSVEMEHCCVLLTAKLESAAKIAPAPPRTTAALPANSVQLVRFNDAVPPPQATTIAPASFPTFLWSNQSLLTPEAKPLPPVIAPSPIRFVVPPLGPVTACCDQRLQTGVYELFLSATPASAACPGDTFAPMCCPALPCQFAECPPPGSNVVGFAAIGSVPQSIADGGTTRPQGVCGYTLMLPPVCTECCEVKVEELKPVKCWPQTAPVAGPPRTPPLPVPSTMAKTILCDGKATLQDMDGKMMLTADRVEIRTAGMAKNPVILKVLLEQYDAASKAGDVEKARTIAAYCLEMDPTCFAKR